MHEILKYEKNELTNDIHFGSHFGSCTFDKTHFQFIDKRNAINAIKNLEENRWKIHHVPYLLDHKWKETQI